MLLALPVAAGTLSIGRPVIQNNQYTFPVNLQGNAEGVAALDFRLNYDPAVFSPVSAQSGTSAAAAQKQVSSNVAEPGEFIVVMMGFNQNVVEPGTVVQVVLEKIGEPASGQSELIIAEPTMATYEGVEIDSSGLARVVRFGEEKTEENTVKEPARGEEKTETDSPENLSQGAPDPGAKPAGSFKFIVAEPTEHGTGKKSGTAEANSTSAPTGTAAAHSPKPAGESSGNPDTVELPPGDAPVARPVARSDGPVNSATAPELADSERTRDGDGAPDAMIVSEGNKGVQALPVDEGGGNRGVLFAILLTVAVALPLSAILLLKLLR